MGLDGKPSHHVVTLLCPVVTLLCVLLFGWDTEQGRAITLLYREPVLLVMEPKIM